MPPKGKKNKGGEEKKGRKAKGPKKRKLKAPLFSPFSMELLMTEYRQNFFKCDKDAFKVEAIPREQFGRALRMCGVMPSERLIDLINERIEKQEPVLTPVVSAENIEGEPVEEIVFTEEELMIKAMLEAGQTVGDILEKKKRSKRKSKKLEEEEEEMERVRKEEEARVAEELRVQEEERLRKEEEEEKKKKPPKRLLTFPESRKKEEIKKIAKMKIRFKRFIKWAEFVNVMWNYAENKQYTGEDIRWAFMTLDPKWDYELEPVWLYGAENPMVPTDELDNAVCASFLMGRQERFIEKEMKRFLKMADFKKESFFNYKEMIEDYNKEASYPMGIAKKKKKLVIQNN